MPPTTRSSFAGGYALRVPFVLVLVALLPLLVSCRQPQQQVAGTIQIELLPPAPGADVLFVTLSDATGQPVTDAQVTVEGNMNHAGMVPVLSGPVTDETSPAADGSDDGSADGVYRVPFQFTMLGDWIITVTAASDSDASGESSRDFELTVEAEGATLNPP